MQQFGNKKFEEFMMDEENNHCFDCGKKYI